MREYPIDISSSGAIKLGDDVACDGFLYAVPVRVQTHVHDDHMHGFEESKGYQEVILSRATRDLLLAEFNADLGFRENISVLDPEIPYLIKGSTVRLIPSGHMLGGVQVQVELAEGMRLGYSSDFPWPIEKVIQVDALVVDSTYGSPDCIRRYMQADAETCLLELVGAKLRFGPIHVKAHRGTIQRALQLLSAELDCPIVASPRFCEEACVYQAHGYPIRTLSSTKSPEGADGVASGRYIRFYGKGDQLPVEYNGTTVTLSAYMARPDNPVLEYSERSYRVALSNHADFNGTIEYVKATGAKYAITDNSRGGHACELARELCGRLNICAVASTPKTTREWGV